MKYSDRQTPILNIVHLGRRGQYPRIVVTCAICGNALHPYKDRDYCGYCRHSVDWKKVGINQYNWRRKNVRVNEKAYKHIY